MFPNIRWIYGLILILLADLSAAQKYDTLEDLRDGRIYLTVKIGNQVWMAENLNYKSKRGSSCYADDKKNCSTYGRLYSWDRVNTICPTGWHASTQNEWQMLMNNLGGTDSAAMHMKLKSALWIKQNPTDDNSSGFSAIPAGKRNHNNDSHSIGYYAYFWIGNESGDYAGCAFLSCTGKDVQFTSLPKESSLSLRCVKDY